MSSPSPNNSAAGVLSNLPGLKVNIPSLSSSNSSGVLSKLSGLNSLSGEGLHGPTLFGTTVSVWQLVTAFVVIAAGIAITRPDAHEAFWKSQTFVGYDDKEWFSTLRGQIRAIFDVKDTVYRGYDEFSKSGKPFAIKMFLSKPLLVLPPSMSPKLKTKTELNSRRVMIDQTKSRWTMPKGVLENDYHLEMVRKQLTRKLAIITDDLADEVRLSFQEHWPNGSEWTPVKLYPLAMKIVARSANRVFTGSQLCRNEAFLDHSAQYARNIFTAALYIRMFPRWSHPIIAPIIAFPNRWHFNVCSKICTPIVEERLTMAIRQREGKIDGEYSPPNDFLQWLIEEGLDSGDPERLSPTELVARLMNLNMAAIHTSSMLFTNIIFDIFSAPDSEDILAGLRDEISRVKPQEGEIWDKNKVARLVRLDSALKESLRYTALGDLSAMRVVTNPHGMQFNKDLTVPMGEHVALPSRAVHRDPNFYPEPERYDPFRFSRIIEQSEESESLRTSQSMVTLDDSFLPFGSGSHACTGRFFAQNELKLVLAEFLENYEVEKLEKRPQNLDILATSTPLDSFEIRTRRRQYS